MLFRLGAANLRRASPGRSSRATAVPLGGDGRSGARSQLPSLVAAVTIAIVLLFFSDMLAFLPNAALAGIVANAVLSLIEVHEFRELWRMRRSEFWIAVVCLLSVLALGPLRAVAIAFLLSTVDVIRRAARRRQRPRGIARRQPLRAARRRRGLRTAGLVVYRFGAPLYFANAPCSLTTSSGWSRSRPLLSAGSCWMRRRWWTSTRPVRGSWSSDHHGEEAARHLRRQRASRAFRAWLAQYEWRSWSSTALLPDQPSCGGGVPSRGRQPGHARRHPNLEKGQ